MGRKKAIKIKQAPTLPNVFAKESAKKNKGSWHKKVFGNKNPIVLELGCGKGEYTLELARQFSKKTFVGFDRKADRIWSGATQALREKIANAFFIHSEIESIDQIFGKNEISEIWITFPDPYLKKPNRRLTCPGFLEKYEKFLKKNGTIHLKTDERRLFAFTISVLEKSQRRIEFATDDLYNSPMREVTETSIGTTYEKRHISEGDSITYIKFKINE